MSEGKDMTISLYIVEDYRLTRAGIKHILSNFQDIKILNEFETAEECIEAMEKQPADIILMDIGLPKMSGIEATKFLKRKYPQTKIVILTSREKDEYVVSALLAGANAYCLKESEEDNLINIIKTVKDGALWLAPQIAQIPFNYLPTRTTGKVCALSEKEKTNLRLSSREISVLNLMAEGKTNPEIAKEIIISVHTVKAHVANIFSKLGVDDRVQAVVKAVKSNIV